MRSRGFWLAIPTAALLACSAGKSASAQDIFIETSGWMPASRVISTYVPTTYLATTSYAVPTTFAAPTVYATSYVTERALVAPTSLVVPTLYQTYRPSIFGRRLIPTGRAYIAPTSYFPTSLYVPSAYYVPTISTFPTSFVSVPSIVDRAVITTGAVVRETSVCCPDAIAMSPSTVTTRVIAPERSTNTSAAPAAEQRRPSVRSEPNIDNEPALESGVEPLPAPAPAKPSAAAAPAPAPAPAPSAAPAENVQSPPAPQAPLERQQSTARPDGTPPPTAPAGEMEPAPVPAPKAPGADDVPLPLAPAGTEDMLPEPPEMGALDLPTRREAQRPVFTPTRAAEPSVRNILFGRVREELTQDPEEGVRILLSNRGGAFEDRVGMTDAFGRFTIRVPDGDWDVKVTMPSGRIYTVSQITVDRGQITDDQGNHIPSLTITR